MSSQVPLPSEKTIPEKRWSCIYLQAAGKIISVLAAASPEKVGLLLPIGVITVYRNSYRMSNLSTYPSSLLDSKRATLPALYSGTTISSAWGMTVVVKGV
jgi:hypothetical protein